MSFFFYLKDIKKVDKFVEYRKKEFLKEKEFCYKQ